MVQLVAAAESSLQVVPVTLVVASVAVNVAFTLVPVVLPLAGAVMFTTGATVSTVKLTVAVPVPAALVAEMTTECVPCERPLRATGLVALVAAPPSSEEVTDVGEFVAVKATDALVELSTWLFVGELIVTTGIDATVKVVLAEPVLPAVSVADTVMVWLPAARPL